MTDRLATGGGTEQRGDGSGFTHDMSTAWAYGHPRQTAIALLSGALRLTGSRSTNYE